MDKRLTMVGLVILVCLIIGGCAMKVKTSGKNIMIEYHPGDSSPAYDKARQICESKGMDVKQEGTACPHFCVTTFRCIGLRLAEEKRKEQPLPQQQPVPGGTGFLFSSKDYIITNYHVVKGASSIDVKFPDGEVIKASVLAKDSQNDIAVLKLAQSPSTQIPDLKFGDSSKVRPGDKVFTIGYPASSILGKNQKITDGIISSVTGIEDDPTMFQITVPIQPGNSGGPLFNESGEVIGITTASLSLNAIRSLGAVPQNVNYAIKSSFVNNLLTTIPKTLLSNRGIVVVPNKSGNSLAEFFERVSNNIVLIEAKE